VTAVTLPAWKDVPRLRVQRFAELALDEVPQLAEAILEEIRCEYPDLPQVLDHSGEPMALIGIRRALKHFIQHLTSGDARPGAQPEIFQGCGREGGMQGLTLDALAISRPGVRLAWRRLAEIGHSVEIPPPAMYELVESGFEYLDGLVAQSVRGNAEAFARRVGERLRLQHRLMEMLLAEHQRSDAIAEHAARIGWRLPTQVAVAVLLRPAREAVTPVVGHDVLLDMEWEQPRMVVPEPDAAGRGELLYRAMPGWAGAIGPAVPLAEAAKSLHWATTAVQLIDRGLLPSGQLLHCAEHTESLVLLPPAELLEDLARRRLAPLAACGPTRSRRLAETLLAWLETRGGAPEIADRLGVHPQTVRYRLRQIRELWGDQMEDPDRRFELKLVLRAQQLRGELGVIGSSGSPA
jgi:hypothetical protein